ncbi:tetratricopeptide (TPR) repeat protein [Sphingomonas sp. F9_3S_D5_B_2]
MDDPARSTAEKVRSSGPVFISYATADRKRALRVCDAIEQRGTDCWLAFRDVQPGENYQEAIVRAIRGAPALVLVFSKSANDSDEIKKELSLASRYRKPVLAVRMEAVEPSDAFAYELATRQWIDAFEGWERALDALIGRIGQASGAADAGASEKRTIHGRSTPRSAHRTSGKWRISALAAALLLIVVGTLWWSLRPMQANAHALTVRLAVFQLLSPELPPTMGDAVRAEISAAFNADGAVGVSTGSKPLSGKGPAYALGGTIQRSGNSIRVIPRLIDERSGATLWSGTFNYEDDVSRLARHIAVDTGNVVRCGLFGASTYHKPMPADVMRNYMQSCQAYWDPSMSEGRKGLVPAERVVAAAPDFSWGWAAVAGAYWKIVMGANDPRQLEQAREAGKRAADRAVAIDPRNSEALFIKAMLLDQRDWLGRGSLLERAVGAQRLDCGCERHQYGDFLVEVGRVTDGVDQLRQANQMLALYVYTPLSLAGALVMSGQPQEAREFYSAAADLAPDSGFAESIRTAEAEETGDLKTLADRKLPISAERRAALVAAYRAVGSAEVGAKAQAVRALLALPEDNQDGIVARLLAGLGEPEKAFQITRRLLIDRRGYSEFLWHPQMRAVLDDPAAPALFRQLGLLDYWKRSHSRPDVCGGNKQPQFCSAI